MVIELQSGCLDRLTSYELIQTKRTWFKLVLRSDAKLALYLEGKLCSRLATLVSLESEFSSNAKFALERGVELSLSLDNSKPKLNQVLMQY